MAVAKADVAENEAAIIDQYVQRAVSAAILTDSASIYLSHMNEIKEFISIIL